VTSWKSRKRKVYLTFLPSKDVHCFIPFSVKMGSQWPMAFDRKKLPDKWEALKRF